MSTALLDRLKEFALPRLRRWQEPLVQGIYPFQRERDGAITRFHMRVDPDGSGILLANASEACRLSASGVIIAHGLLNDFPVEAIRVRLRNTFHDANEQRMGEDIARVRQAVDDLAHPSLAFPVANLDDPSIGYRERALAAPYRADLPILDLETTTRLLNQLWEAGIPHVVFRPEATDTLEATIPLVERAGDLGMISGVRAPAEFFADAELHHKLAVAGVDHLTIPMAPPQELHAEIVGGDIETVQAVVSRSREWELCVLGQLPLVDATFDRFHEMVEAARGLGVENFAAFAIAVPEGEEPSGALTANMLPQAAAWVEEAAHGHGVNFLWEPSLRRDTSCELRDQVLAGPRASGDAGIRIDRDGMVYPPRGPRTAAGNLLTDPWVKIWGHPVFRDYRERVAAVTRCETCPGLTVCAADCPRSEQGWADDRAGGEA